MQCVIPLLVAATLSTVNYKNLLTYPFSTRAPANFGMILATKVTKRSGQLGHELKSSYTGSGQVTQV